MVELGQRLVGPGPELDVVVAADHLVARAQLALLGEARLHRDLAEDVVDVLELRDLIGQRLWVRRFECQLHHLRVHLHRQLPVVFHQADRPALAAHALLSAGGDDVVPV